MNSRQDGQNRTSATDREAVARQLAAAASQGRLSSQGLEKRLFLTHEADTYDQLEELVADLPGAQEPVARTVPEHTVPETLHLTASLRNARRGGRWKVPRHTVASAGLGEVVLDFTQAQVAYDEVSVEARPNVGNVELIVPEGYAISTEETVPGSQPVHVQATADAQPNLPRLHVIAHPGWGSITVRHPQRKRRFLPFR